MAGKIKCSECEHCERFSKLGTRSKFYCEHPNQGYILDFFKKNKIQKYPGFISFGKSNVFDFEDKPSIKTSPAWCPKKQKEK